MITITGLPMATFPLVAECRASSVVLNLTAQAWFMTSIADRLREEQKKRIEQESAIQRAAKNALFGTTVRSKAAEFGMKNYNSYRSEPFIERNKLILILYYLMLSTTILVPQRRRRRWRRRRGSREVRHRSICSAMEKYRLWPESIFCSRLWDIKQSHSKSCCHSQIRSFE